MPPHRVPKMVSGISIECLHSMAAPQDNATGHESVTEGLAEFHPPQRLRRNERTALLTASGIFTAKHSREISGVRR